MMKGNVQKENLCMKSQVLSYHQSKNLSTWEVDPTKYVMLIQHTLLTLPLTCRPIK